MPPQVSLALICLITGALIWLLSWSNRVKERLARARLGRVGNADPACSRFGADWQTISTYGSRRRFW